MKKITLLYIILSFPYYNIQAQEIPDFENNVTEQEKGKSLVFNEFRDKYEMLISYTRSCYWGEKKQYVVLGYKEQQWNAFYWIITFKDRDKKNIKKSKIKKLNIAKRRIADNFGEVIF